jgi:hypothetical protein
MSSGLILLSILHQPALRVDVLHCNTAKTPASIASVDFRNGLVTGLAQRNQIALGVFSVQFAVVHVVNVDGSSHRLARLAALAVKGETLLSLSTPRSALDIIAVLFCKCHKYRRKGGERYYSPSSLSIRYITIQNLQTMRRLAP